MGVFVFLPLIQPLTALPIAWPAEQHLHPRVAALLLAWVGTILAACSTQIRSIPSDRLTFLTVPHYGRVADVPSDKANVVWQYPQAADLFASLAKDQEVDKEKVAADAKNPVYAATVRVQVLNGSGVPGRAAKVAETLRTAGYTITGTGNAPGSAGKTAVVHPEGLEEQAGVLASRLPGVAMKPDAGALAGTVTLIVGADFTGIR
ncbi:LytR C-terminal domain-containing protein [Streptomyces sp. EN27]|uniref:LytR C-terminal domain-containing protein n=1 Tax=Streptomyces sp. EN27 TaxID=211464 RepID=UPI000851701E